MSASRPFDDVRFLCNRESTARTWFQRSPSSEIIQSPRTRLAQSLVGVGKSLESWCCWWVVGKLAVSREGGRSSVVAPIIARIMVRWCPQPKLLTHCANREWNAGVRRPLDHVEMARAARPLTIDKSCRARDELQVRPPTTSTKVLRTQSSFANAASREELPQYTLSHHAAVHRIVDAPLATSERNAKDACATALRAVPNLPRVLAPPAALLQHPHRSKTTARDSLRMAQPAPAQERPANLLRLALPVDAQDLVQVLLAVDAVDEVLPFLLLGV